MDKAEKYLNNRISILTVEKAELLTKIEETDLEVSEMECKIKNLQENIDDTFQIFSPRTKKNDFIKNEIEGLNNKIISLKKIRGEYEEKVNSLSDEINDIKEILNIDVYADKAECNDIQNEEIEEAEEISSDDIAYKNTGLDSLDSTNVNLSEITMEQLIIEEQRLFIAGKIEDKTLQPISSLIHKCEICRKVLEVDAGRARLEIEVMSKSLSELYNNIKEITACLRKPVGEDDDIIKKDDFKSENAIKDTRSEKKAPVKKLSMNLSMGKK